MNLSDADADVYSKNFKTIFMVETIHLAIFKGQMVQGNLGGAC
jgi:hypothetical protein